MARQNGPMTSTRAEGGPVPLELPSPASLVLRGRTFDAARPAVMAVINRTPDSFFSGNRHADLDSALAALELAIDNGADLVDVGGVRAGQKGEVVTPAQEIDRVLPDPTRDWVPLTRPEPNHKELSDELSETAIAFGAYTAVYQRRNEGNYWLPPSELRVTDARGRVVVERKDTERVWHAQNACNLPAFELVGASAKPGVILFRTGLGMGGHDCDGIVQPPHWHVLAF